MSKIHSDTRVIDNKGNAKLAEYCAFHNPQISWRAITHDDIGIDGELELYNDKGEPMAEILKVQLKSTEKDKGYIKNENPNTKTFTFYAERSHVEYWQNLPNDILLIIYDNRNDQNRLYAKKVENIDLKNVGTKSVPIQFHQELDLLEAEKHDFLHRFSRLYNTHSPTIKPVPEGNEKLVSNLLKISFPSDNIFIAPMNFERDEVIKASWETDKRLKFTATPRAVVWSAMRQKGLNFGTDWVVFKNQIITFHDLSDHNKPISSVVDTSLVESFTPEDFCSISEDHKNIFKSLLRNCMQQVLYKQKFEWDVEDKLFRYIAPNPIEGNFEKKESWVGTKQAKRTVFKARYWDKGKFHYCTHFAFSIDIKDFGDRWYLCINPTWAVTVNGQRKSKVGYKKVSQLKKLERNSSVYNHLRFITYKLTYRDFFTRDYPYLQFHQLASFKTDIMLDEKGWLNTETEEESKLLRDIEAPIDIRDED
ncbi:DUF4365 domain-containing protein [Pontibacter qinzhouensis]|uniref:DUF4365 domain-containing protein n=1 Tax=Pontibacter qinzhouensis TaxID=2603253 RepID=A0A5C8JHV0_9BACT|nr:DUF4365 domain-containing protein [Pontibacter qinzhouensis]TXK37900.1 DUF4365 domain-containing protein [Pontibacter qinzhouensis]